MATLGKGGFGKAKFTIYEGKPAVVKYIDVNNSPSATLATCTVNRQNAEEEGKVMEKFKVYNYIAQIYAIKGHAIYMKYYPLGSLRSVIDSGKANNNRYIIAKDIIRGLSIIHNNGFVHSDLKARNILCEERRYVIRAVISDFGAARKVGSNSGAYTSGFVPPEFHHKPLSYATDYYSLGKLFLELFTKRTNVASINYYNFYKYANIKDFSSNYSWDEDFITQMKLYELVKNCLRDEPDKRTTVKDFDKFFIRVLGPFFLE